MANANDADEAQEPVADDPRRWFDDAPDAIVLLDPVSETVVDANSKACALYGFARADFLGMAFGGIGPDLGELSERELELAHYGADGHEILLEVRASSTVHQGRRATLCVLRDVTLRQGVEQQRRAAAAVKLAARLRRDLLATLSHELRTPLASIVGVADLLLDLHLAEPAPEYARLIRSAAERLVEALDDAADFFESETDAPAPDAADSLAHLASALAREVLERMRNGRAGELRPADRRGFPARFDLALAEPRAGAGPDTGEPVAQILLAEDDPVNRMVALHQLRSLGYRVTVVENGHEVLAAIEQGRFDVVLMDCQMPELDGWEATRQIRRRETSGERLPIIAVTAHALEGDRERCLAAGMDDYLSKPYREKVLGAVLERWVGRGSSTG